MTSWSAVWRCCCIVCTVLATACGGGGSSSSPAQADDDGFALTPMPSLSFCQALRATAHGQLCAITPSLTDPAIDDGSPLSLGLGDHVVAIPNTADGLRGVWLHFGGSYGKPYSSFNNEYASLLWLDELMAQGYLVIQPAYRNESSVSYDLCAVDSPGFAVDDCAGGARAEILDGVDHSPVVEVAAVDGVDDRLLALNAYLEALGFSMPEYFSSTLIDWSRLRLSGHSQGAGHAWMLAKQRGVRAACLIGGPYDLPDSVNPSALYIADWYLLPGAQTPIDDVGAFLVVTDANYNAFVGAYGVIGLRPGVDWFEAPDGDYSDQYGEPIDDGHAASIGARELAADRARACFVAAGGS